LIGGSPAYRQVNVETEFGVVSLILLVYNFLLR